MKPRFLLFSSALVAGACGGRTTLESPTDAAAESSSEGGVSANPLVGTWLYVTRDSPFEITVTFGADGSVTSALTETGCTGSLTLSAGSWTSTSDTLTLTGKETCSGSIECTTRPQTTTSEGVKPALDAVSCQYTFGTNDDTLDLNDCTGSGGVPMVYTRQ